MSKRKFRKKVSAFLATSLVASIVVPVVLTVVNAESIPTDLFISEYIEGCSFNKAIEIYNGIGKQVDLSLYSLELYSNGFATASQTLNLSGILEDGDTYVLFNNSANEEIKNKGGSSK